VRESLLMLSGKAKYTHLEAGRLYTSPDVGPLGCLFVSRAYAAVNDASSARLFAKRGLELMTIERFGKDCDALFGGDSAQAKVLRAVMASLRDMADSEIDALGTLIGPRGAAMLKEVALLGRASPKDNGGVGPALQRALWEAGMQAALEAALTDLSKTK
jgi:hypothetical protein